jgi:HEAT repeat protein
MDRLARALAIHPGEGRPVALVAGAFATIEAGRGLGEVGVATLVVDSLGAEVLPVLYIGLGILGLVATLGYGALLTRSSNPRFLPRVLLVLAAVLAMEWVALLVGPSPVLAIAWISVFAAGMLLLTLIWTVGGLSFDARQAKRVFPLLVSAAIVGSLAGYLSAIVLQRVIGLEALVLGEAALLLVAAGLLRSLGDRVRPPRASGADRPGILRALSAGAAYVAASPLMRLVAVAYVLLAILLFSLDFPFFTAMEAAYPDPGQLLTVLALLSSAVTLTAFLVGTLLANRLYARFGVASSALLLPIVYLAAFGLWVVSFTTTTAVVARFSQQVTQRGVTNAAFGAFFSVLPAARRGGVLAFMDGVPGQLGTMLSGILLVAAASLALEQVFVVGLVAAVACVCVGIGIRRAYARTLVQTLREGRAEQLLDGGPGLASLAGDARVISELRLATRAEGSPERLLAADLLRRVGATTATEDLRRLAADPDADVRRAALLAIAELGGDDAEPLLRAALADPAPQVRAAAVAGLARRGEGVAVRPFVTGMLASGTVPERIAALGALEALPGGADAGPDDEALDQLVRSQLDSPSVLVRAAALRPALMRSLIDVDVLTATLDDGAREVRTEAARLLRDRPEAAASLLDVVRRGSDEAQEAALQALDGHVETVRADLLAWADGQVRRAGELRGHAVLVATIEGSDTGPFLGHVLRRRSAVIQARLLQCLAVLGAPEASSLIRRCLNAPEPDVRAQAVEAIEALGDPRLARGVIRLLEQDARPPGSATLANSIASLETLARDEDPWVRALALRTLLEHHASAERSAADRVRDDPSPIVRAALDVAEGGDTVPEELRLVNEVDRMLVLRRVPIFASLGPEDLQRVAAAASERSWAEGDVLMREGEIGSDLIVIVEGTVSVIHEDEGARNVLRRVGPGEHIGELAVLREAPRAATVEADGPHVRGLVISGEAVHALLRERPDAAMAMLATLAERMSQHRR